VGSASEVMRRLEDLPIGHRIAITVIIVLVILFALALFGYLTGGWDAEAQAIPPSKYDKRIAELDREAIDEAYKEKIQALFNTWLSDTSDQPSRAIKGAQNARRAYIGAMQAIERKEAELLQR
jgi:hypothetical protein